MAAQQCRRQLKKVTIPVREEYIRRIGDNLCKEEKTLFRLATFGASEKLDEFLRINPYLDKEKVNEACHTVLQEAVGRRDVNIVEVLLNHKCDPHSGIELAAQIGACDILDVLLAAVDDPENHVAEANRDDDLHIDTAIPEEMDDDNEHFEDSGPDSLPTFYKLSPVPRRASTQQKRDNSFLPKTLEVDETEVGGEDDVPLSWSRRVLTRQDSEERSSSPSPRFTQAGPFLPKHGAAPPRLPQRFPSHPATTEPTKMFPDSPDYRPPHMPHSFDRSLSLEDRSTSHRQYQTGSLPRRRISDNIGKNIGDNIGKKSAPTGSSRRKSLAGITSQPLILAATADDYKGTELLIKVGLKILEPHEPSCCCETCKKVRAVNHDLLHEAHDRIEKYRALTSAPYILLTSEDPILTSLKRSDLLAELATLYPENKMEFEELSKRSSTLAVDLLRKCISEKEVVQLLMEECGLKERGIFKYGRLQLAVGLSQKEFVTNSTCQHSLYSLWLGPRKTWLKWSIARKLSHVIIHLALAPLICTAYILVTVLPSTAKKAHAPTELPLKDEMIPEESFAKRFREDPICILTSAAAVPLNRFLYSASAYLLFLVLLLYFIVQQGAEETDADSGLIWYHWLLCTWIIAHVYKIAQDLYTERFLSYWNNWWTLYELIMMIAFAFAACFFIAARIEVLDEKTWRLALVAEGLFAIATTMSCMRTLQWMHLSQDLGPVIISFSRMTTVIGQLFIVFLIVLLSFSMGLYAVYQNFRLVQNATSEEHEEDKGLFISYTRTLQALFWAIFGHGESEYASIPEGYAWHVTASNGDDSFLDDPNDSFPVAVGYTLWGLFHVAFVIVLLNMLIAVMTNCFEVIQENFDVEWKFARTKLWMYYLEDHNAVPPPFNILLPLTSLIALIARKAKRLTCLPFSHSNNVTVVDGFEMPTRNESSKSFLSHSNSGKHQDHADNYKQTMTTLIQRYVKSQKVIKVKEDKKIEK